MVEEIIINDVNVAGCRELQKDCQGEYVCLDRNRKSLYCNDQEYCYYKQLKRLEQENKELKKTVMTKCPLCGEGFLTPVGAELYEQNNTYRSALEEIREDMEQDTTCESRECGCDDYAECLNCIKETILNKINEVLNEKFNGSFLY